MTPRVTLVLFAAGLLALRLALVLSHDNLLGVDGGAYIFSKNYVLGLQDVGTVWPRPPLAPGWLLVPFTYVWGDDVGYKIFSALLSLAPIGPAFLLFRKFLPPWPASISTMLMAMDVHLNEMLVTGVAPLIGFSFLTLALWAMWDMHRPERSTPGRMAVLALTIPFMAFTNQTTAGLALLVIPLFMVSMAAFWKGASGQSSIGPLGRIVFTPVAFLPMTLSLIAGAALALTALPWYIGVRPGSDLLRYPGNLIEFGGVSDISFAMMLFTAPVGAAVAFLARSHQLKALGVVVSFLSVMTMFGSSDEALMNVFYRAGYLRHALGVWSAMLVWLAWRYYPIRAPELGYSAASVMLAMLLWAGIWGFHRQAYLSDMVTRDSLTALKWLHKNYPGEGIATNTYSLSVWVEALNGVSSPPIWQREPPPYYTREYEHVRCIAGWVPACDVKASQQAVNVNWLLVETKYPKIRPNSASDWLSPPDQWQVTAQSEHLELVYSKGTTRLWRIGGAAAFAGEMYQ